MKIYILLFNELFQIILKYQHLFIFGASNDIANHFEDWIVTLCAEKLIL